MMKKNNEKAKIKWGWGGWVIQFMYVHVCIQYSAQLSTDQSLTRDTVKLFLLNMIKG